MTNSDPLDQERPERVLAEAAIAGLLDALSGRLVFEEEFDQLLDVTNLPELNSSAADCSS